MMMPTVFVVSREAAVCDSVEQLVAAAGLQAETFASLQAFLDLVEPGRRGCLVYDAHVGDLTDQDRQARLVAVCARMPGLLLVDRGDIPMAVRALKAGAADVVQKPYQDDNLIKSINKALDTDALTHG